VLTFRSCEIDYTKINAANFTLQTIDICTQKDNYILQDGFKSFPSGHSSGRSASSRREELH
jgi:membrane-associated phospholipid phosphatase